MRRAGVLANVTVERLRRVPAYLQLAESFKRNILQGRLKPGDALPTVQEISAQLGLSTATVMRAMTQLGMEGMIVTRRGSRSTVASRQAGSTEIFIYADGSRISERLAAFYNEILDGLKAAHQPHHRFWPTFLHDPLPTPGELLAVSRARRTDGIIAYRPNEAMRQALSLASAQIPTVSLFCRMRTADAVLVDPVSALRKLLEKRLKQGRRLFAYAGMLGALENSRRSEGDPYWVLYKAFLDTLGAAGIHPAQYLIEDWSPQNAAQVARQLTPGTIVLTLYPIIAEALINARQQLELISYTEAGRTAHELANKVTLLVARMDKVGKAAAEVLRARQTAGSAEPARTVCLEPELIEADHSSEQERGKA